LSRNLTRTQAILLGLLVVVTLALGGSALLVLNERSGWGSGSIRIFVGFPDINGVEVGTRVRIQGIDAGEVEAIHPPQVPGEPVKLQLRIAGKYRHLVREDAKVQIAADSLLAGKIVRIVPGATSANPIEDRGELRADLQPDALEGIAKAAGKLNNLLSEVDAAMQALRKDNGAVTQDLVNAAKKLNAVLTKADAALDDIDKGHGTLGKLVKDEKLYKELTETLLEVKAAIGDVRGGEGALGKQAMASLADVRQLVNSVKQNSDAIKSLPVVRSYVIDINKELIRPDCTRYRIWCAESDLFEPGRAILTAKGKSKLDDAAEWLIKHKYDDSEILVAAFAEPGQPAEFAATVTQKQAEVVVEYLRTKKVHHTGWWWWSVRPIRPLGCGNNPTPVPETEKMPAARIEMLVFVPQK
jgi:phospholipid/cholesterol/gamma-HCH transport system substrate-binding protein